MTPRRKAIAYLTEGHALLRAHGLYGRSEEEHFFALDCALNGIEKNGGHPAASEAAAAIQALYEAKRLITARASIEGRRIILGDWFLSHAVGLALPLRTPAITAFMTNELSVIGTNLYTLSPKNSRKEFTLAIDKFIDTLSVGDAAKRLTRSECDETAPGGLKTTLSVGDAALGVPPAQYSKLLHKQRYEGYRNPLITAIASGYYKTTAAEVAYALSQMESLFAAMYASEDADEKSGWISGALMSGGKRLRPILAHLCSGFGAADANSIIHIMSTIELIHSASLVHDDIVDRSPMRRSRATINAEKGDAYAAMCGFKMISDALNLLSSGVPGQIPEIIAAIPMQMCGGELDQFDIENKPELQNEEEYCRRISSKTAALIEGSCVCGAIAGGADDEIIKLLGKYGRELGMLFQLRDDLLDYGAPEESGKPVSQDMERGIYSLPLLYAKKVLTEKNPAEAAKLTAVMSKHIKHAPDFRYLNETAENTGGLAYTREAIKTRADRAGAALDLLPQGQYTEALTLLLNTLAGSTITREAAPDALKAVQ